MAVNTAIDIKVLDDDEEEDDDDGDFPQCPTDSRGCKSSSGHISDFEGPLSIDKRISCNKLQEHNRIKQSPLVDNIFVQDINIEPIRFEAPNYTKNYGIKNNVIYPSKPPVLSQPKTPPQNRYALTLSPGSSPSSVHSLSDGPKVCGDVLDPQLNLDTVFLFPDYTSHHSNPPRSRSDLLLEQDANANESVPLRAPEQNHNTNVSFSASSSQPSPSLSSTGPLPFSGLRGPGLVSVLQDEDYVVYNNAVAGVNSSTRTTAYEIADAEYFPLRSMHDVLKNVSERLNAASLTMIVEENTGRNLHGITNKRRVTTSTSVSKSQQFVHAATEDNRSCTVDAGYTNLTAGVFTFKSLQEDSRLCQRHLHETQKLLLRVQSTAQAVLEAKVELSFAVKEKIPELAKCTFELLKKWMEKLSNVTSTLQTQNNEAVVSLGEHIEYAASLLPSNEVRSPAVFVKADQRKDFENQASSVSSHKLSKQKIQRTSQAPSILNLNSQSSRTQRLRLAVLQMREVHAILGKIGTMLGHLSLAVDVLIRKAQQIELLLPVANRPRIYNLFTDRLSMYFTDIAKLPM